MSAMSITERRTLATESASRTVGWSVNEFDDGRAYMLTATAGSFQLSMHFTGEQWAEFQALIQGTPVRLGEGLVESALDLTGREPGR